MARPDLVDLGVPNPEWRDAPMPGANAPFALRRLASDDGAFTVHGRFPAGFERATPGGYAVPEEFLVLEGELLLEDRVFRRGDLVFVPARFLRTTMRAPQGCTVLAWFGGPAEFVEAAGLRDPCTTGLESVRVEGAAPGPLLSLPTATWSVVDPTGPLDAVGAAADLVEGGLRRWRRVTGPIQEPVRAEPPCLLRLAT